MESRGLLTSDLLRICAKYLPDKAPIRSGVNKLTYLEWHLASSGLARRLVQAGVRPYDRVIIAFPEKMWIDYVISLLAAQKAGATPVSLPEVIAKSFGKQIAVNAGAAWQLGTVEIDGLMRINYENRAFPDENPDFQIPVTSDAIAEIITTSGTTAHPKLIACPHGNMVWLPHRRSEFPVQHAQLSSLPVAEQRSETRLLAFVSIGTNAAQRIVSRALYGLPVIHYLMPYFDVALMTRMLTEERIDDVTLVPVLAAAFVRSCDSAPFESVKVVHLGSAQTPASTVNRLIRIFPNAEIRNEYGLSEGGSIRVQGTYNFDNPSHVGIPLPGTDVRITDISGAEVPHGSSGLIWVRSAAPHQRFYYNDEIVSRSVFSADGWIATSDLGFIDKDGGLILEGRTGEVANVGGYKVSLMALDAIVSEMEGVLECASFVLPHPTMGDLICMATVVDPASRGSFERSKGRVAASLGYMAPRVWMDVDEIPRTVTGKPIRRKLKMAHRRLYT